MAKVDVETLDYLITDVESKIKDLEQQRVKLREKRGNTIRCPKCNCYWDALYLKSIKNVQRIKRYDDEPEMRPTFCHELKVFWECPDCKSSILISIIVGPRKRKETIRQLRYRATLKSKGKYYVGEYQYE